MFKMKLQMSRVIGRCVASMVMIVGFSVGSFSSGYPQTKDSLPDSALARIITEVVGLETGKSALASRHSFSSGTELIPNVLTALRSEVENSRPTSVRLTINSPLETVGKSPRYITDFDFVDVTLDERTGTVLKVAANRWGDQPSDYKSGLDSISLTMYSGDEDVSMRFARMPTPIAFADAVDTAATYFTFNNLVELEGYLVQFKWLGESARPTSVPPDSVPVWIIVFKKLDPEVTKNARGAEILTYRPHFAWAMVDTLGKAGPPIGVEYWPD